MNTTKSICVSEAIQNNKIYSIKVFSLFKTNWNRFYYFVKKIFFFSLDLLFAFKMKLK